MLSLPVVLLGGRGGRLLMMSKKKTPLILTELFLVAGGEEDVCGFPGLPVGGQLLLGPGPNKPSSASSP